MSRSAPFFKSCSMHSELPSLCWEIIQTARLHLNWRFRLCFVWIYPFIFVFLFKSLLHFPPWCSLFTTFHHKEQFDCSHLACICSYLCLCCCLCLWIDPVSVSPCECFTLWVFHLAATQRAVWPISSNKLVSAPASTNLPTHESWDRPGMQKVVILWVSYVTPIMQQWC